MSGIPGTIKVPKGGQKAIPDQKVAFSGQKKIRPENVIGPSRSDRWEIFKTERALKREIKAKVYLVPQDRAKEVLRNEMFHQNRF